MHHSRAGRSTVRSEEVERSSLAASTASPPALSNGEETVRCTEPYPTTEFIMRARHKHPQAIVHPETAVTTIRSCVPGESTIYSLVLPSRGGTVRIMAVVLCPATLFIGAHRAATAAASSAVEARPVGPLDGIASTRWTDLTLPVKACATVLALVRRRSRSASG
jgi:predicted metal-dependent RNase